MVFEMNHVLPPGTLFQWDFKAIIIPYKYGYDLADTSSIPLETYNFSVPSFVCYLDTISGSLNKQSFTASFLCDPSLIFCQTHLAKVIPCLLFLHHFCKAIFPYQHLFPFCVDLSSVANNE